RLHVIAGIDSSFKMDGVFHDELMEHRSVLMTQYNKMVDGIRCDTAGWALTMEMTGAADSWVYDVACADIYSGEASMVELQYSSEYPLSTTRCWDAGNEIWNQACLAQREVDYTAWYQMHIVTVQNELREQVLSKLPLSDLQSLIDTLDEYANPRGLR